MVNSLHRFAEQTFSIWALSLRVDHLIWSFSFACYFKIKVSISIRLVVALLGGGLLGGCSSPCKHFSFREVSPGIMVGCRPTTQTDFDVLRKHGIRTILSLETFNYHVGP